FHDTSSGEFSIVKVPISQVLGNKTRAELINHLTALANRQKQGKTEAEQALLYSMNQRMDANIVLRASGQPTEDIADAEMEATGISAVGRLKYSDDFERAGMAHEMSVVMSTGDFDALIDASNEIRERINAADTVVAADAVVRGQVFDALVRTRNKDIENDSYAWIIQASGNARGAMDPPEDLPHGPPPLWLRLDTVYDEFDRHGVPEHTRRPLSKPDAEALVRQYADQENSLARVRFLRALRDNYGPYHGTMIRELINAGLPDHTAITGEVESIETAMALDDASSIPESELRGALRTGEATNIENLIDSKTGKFREFANAMSPGNRPVEAIYRNALLKLSYVNSINGDRATAAVRNAEATLFQEWEIIGNTMVPKNQIDDGVRRALSSPDIVVDAIMDRIDPVETFANPDLGELKELGKERFIMSLRFAPKLYINEANTGVHVWVQDGKARDAEGQPIMLTWEELSALGRKTTGIEDLPFSLGGF
ncbi:hypothetical protein LCGC14_1053710, partial [marine sediment metagenome]